MNNNITASWWERFIDARIKIFWSDLLEEIDDLPEIEHPKGLE